MNTPKVIKDLAPVLAFALGGLLAGTGSSALAADEAVDAEALEAARAELQRAKEDLERASRALQELTGPLDSIDTQVRREVIRLGNRERPVIGIVMSEAGDGRDGIRLSAVTPGGPADEAGLRSGDNVVAINGVRLGDREAVAEARELFDGMEEGDRYVLTVRDGDTRRESEIEVEAASMAPTQSFTFSFGEPHVVVNGQSTGEVAEFQFEVKDLREELERVRENLYVRMPEIQFGDPESLSVWRWGFGWSGLELARINAGLGRYFGVEEGALVLEAEDLEDSDLLAGDVIISVSGRPVSSPNEVMRELRRYEAGEGIDVEVVRDGRPIDVRITAPKGPHNAFQYGWSQQTEDG